MNSSNLILDGNNILYRAYHVVKNKRLVGDVDISSVEQWFRMVKGYKEAFDPTSVYVAWDKKTNPNGRNFRKDLIDYKGNREVDEVVTSRIHETTNFIINLCNKLGIRTILPYNLEGDDVIYFLTKELLGKNVVVSGDKDLFQLVSENVSVYNTNKNEIIDVENFEEKVGISREYYIDYKCILGDTSDNIFGLHKYGPVKAKKLALSKDWASLTEEQIKILETNRLLIDLSYGPNSSSDEWNSYRDQMKILYDYDEKGFFDICDNHDLKNLKKQAPIWESLSNNILELLFDLP